MLEAHAQFKKYGMDFKSRVLTDQMSGRTDWVVAEWEVDGVAEFEAGMNKVMSNPEAQQLFQAWFEKLAQLIHYAEADNWNIR